MFHYQNDELYCENVALAEMVAAVGSPVYVYSKAEMVGRAREYLRLVPKRGWICYATKANSNPVLLSELAALGLGADVTSGGELYLALQAGFDRQKIFFSGVGKTDAEIEMALEAGIAALHVESEQELAVIEEIAAAHGIVASIGVRLNPNIRAETHPYISTGLNEHKFGVEPRIGASLLVKAATSPNLYPAGIAAHIGSQICDIAPYVEAAELLAALGTKLRAARLMIDYIDIGGGLGIDYAQWAGERQDRGWIAEWMEAVSQPIAKGAFAFMAEPGRSIIGPAGCLVTRTTFTKARADKRFVITDAGMSDLLRPTLYQAVHPIVPLRESRSLDNMPADVVGPICESSDFLGKERPLSFIERGDLLAVMNAGAYGFAMSSNYNGRLRPAEVLVDGDRWELIRPRQTYDDL